MSWKDKITDAGIKQSIDLCTLDQSAVIALRKWLVRNLRNPEMSAGAKEYMDTLIAFCEREERRFHKEWEARSKNA